MVIGVLADQRGLVIHRDEWGQPEYSECRAQDYAQTQDAGLPLLLRHDPDVELGTVEHLERLGNVLLAVASLNERGTQLLADYPHEGWCYSAGSTSAIFDHGVRRRVGVRLREVSITETPANVGLGKVAWSSNGTFPARTARSLGWADTWHRGAEAATKRVRVAGFPLLRSRTIEVVDNEFEELVARSRAAIAAKPKPSTRPTMPMPALRGEVLPPGVHRRNCGKIISIDGRPV